MARKSNETLTLIEEITRNDGSKYYEISNMVQNGRAELAAIRSTNVIKYENYVNENFEMPPENFTEFEEWKKTPEMEEIVEKILKENHIG